MARFVVIDGKPFELGRVTEVDIKQKHLFIEEMADGRLRLTCSRAFGLNVAALRRIEITHEHDDTGEADSSNR